MEISVARQRKLVLLQKTDQQVIRAAFPVVVVAQQQPDSRSELTNLCVKAFTIDAQRSYVPR